MSVVLAVCHFRACLRWNHNLNTKAGSSFRHTQYLSIFISVLWLCPFLIRISCSPYTWGTYRLHQTDSAAQRIYLRFGSSSRCLPSINVTSCPAKQSNTNSTIRWFCFSRLDNLLEGGLTVSLLCQITIGFA